MGWEHVGREAPLGETDPGGGGKAAPGRYTAKRDRGAGKGEMEPNAAGGRGGSVPGARETCKEGRTGPGPRALTGQLPARATRQRRRDRSSDIFTGAVHCCRTGEATGLRHSGGAKTLHRNAPSGDGATCCPEGAFASPTWRIETTFHKGITPRR